MSQPQEAKPAKLVIGLLLNNKSLLPVVAADLERVIGQIDAISAWMDFDFTDYYCKEMGKPLYRRMLVFKRLIEQETLAEVKLATNDVEQTYTNGGNRCVNIDPGYLLLERFVLATGKNYTHRIYIGRGIYADLTLIFQKGAYRALPWTYPDYSDGKMLGFLNQVRLKYAADLRLSSTTSNRLNL
jgi:hypothetical protein